MALATLPPSLVRFAVCRNRPAMRGVQSVAAMSEQQIPQTTPLTYPRAPALINEYWRVVAAERRAMFRAWAAWLDQRPNPEHVETEIAATESVLRQMVRLRDEAP